MATAPPVPPTAAAPRAPVASPARAPDEPIESRDLLAGARELLIRHGDAIYRLQVTSLGKLILTK